MFFILWPVDVTISLLTLLELEVPLYKAGLKYLLTKCLTSLVFFASCTVNVHVEGLKCMLELLWSGLFIDAVT